MPRPTNEARITGYLLQNGKATLPSLRTALGLVDTGIRRALDNLLADGVIEEFPPKKEPTYKLVNVAKTEKAYGNSKAGQI